MKPFFPFLFVIFSFPFCQTSHAVAVPPVILTPQGTENLGLKTETVAESDFAITTFALGRTEAMPEARSTLSSRISGRVIETNLAIGRNVTKGENLVLLESRQPGEPPPKIWLTAPADGTVISVNTRLGAPVEATDRLAEFAELKTIYLIAKLPQATAGKISQGTQAKIRFPILPDKEFTATLLKFAACSDLNCIFDQEVSTRMEKDDDADLNTASVIFTIDNPENKLRPGMSAECSIIMKQREGVLSVPREAIQGAPSNRHVYVKHVTIPHAFDRVSVQTGLVSNERIEIIDGLLPGDEVVTRGAYSLGFAGSGGGPSLKEAMDAAHGHEHNEDGSEKSLEQKAAGAEKSEASHGHTSQGISMREGFFMVATGILALLLVVFSLRRNHVVDATQELS